MEELSQSRIHLDRSGKAFTKWASPGECEFCGSHQFRRSRLRQTDYMRVLFWLQYPVRCLRCKQRQVASITTAGLSVPSGVKQRSRRSQRVTWQTFTAQSNHPNEPVPTGQPEESGKSDDA
jgi:hypothetical protein